MPHPHGAGTKREAEVVCAQLVAEAARGEHGNTAAGTLCELVDRWLEHVGPNLSPSTLAAYGVYLRRHILPALANQRVDRLKPADLDRFYASFRGAPTLASIRKIYTILRSALGQATIASLRRQRARQDERAVLCGTAVAANGYTFARDVLA